MINTQVEGRRVLPPEAKGLPLVGSLPELLLRQHNFFVEAHKKYGEIYTLDLGVVRLVVLNNPVHAQHVLRDKCHNYQKGGGFWAAMRGVLGNGLVVSEGDFWLRQRRMIQPQFHRKRLAALTNLMVDAIEEEIAGWARYGDRIVDLSRELAAISMRVTARVMFGSGISRAEIDKVLHAFTFALDYILQSIVINALPAWLPLPGTGRMKRSRKEIDEVVYRVIRESREAARSGNHADHMLSMLTTSVDEETGDKMTDQQLRDEAITFFVGGYETTAVTLSWTFYYLFQQKAAHETLRNEIFAVVGDKRPDYESFSKMSYAQMVLKESMRLRPPGWVLPRVTREDDTIDGYTIPAGTQVILPIYMYHRHPAFWEEPEKFLPERFSQEQVAKRHAFSWIPFGAGQRICIGKDFSLIDGALILAMISQRYEIRPAGELSDEPYLSTTLRMKKDLPVRITPKA